jgi:hypothetical protein
MADASVYAENIRKYAKGYNKAAAEKIVGHLGIALRHKDSSVVACSDDDRIRGAMAARLDCAARGACMPRGALGHGHVPRSDGSFTRL